MQFIDLNLISPLFFSLFTIKELYFLVMAFCQERTLVFTSQSMNLVSCCVLSMIALIRPFEWPHLQIALVP